jgi:hypothetical protein
MNLKLNIIKFVQLGIIGDFFRIVNLDEGLEILWMFLQVPESQNDADYK